MIFKEDIYNNFVIDFSNILRENTKYIETSQLIFLCIGTDKVMGDSFGPLVGYKLKYLYKNQENIKVIGSLDNIICIHNISKIINYIENKYKKSFVIAIDAAISNKMDLGKILVSKESMNNPKYNFKLLQNTSLNLVMNMADLVVQGIYDVINV